MSSKENTIRPSTFDPTGPVGVGDDEPVVFSDLGEPDEADLRLDGLVELATRPPAGLTLDHNALRAALASEPAPWQRGGRRPWLIGLYASSAAVAAAIVLAMVLTFQWTGSSKPGDELAAAPPSNRMAAVGVEMTVARHMVEQPSEDSNEVRVFFPRRSTPRIAEAPAARADVPMLITDHSPSFGTPHTNRDDSDAGSDFMTVGFME